MNMKAKILVVDDEEDQQEIFVQRFTGKPYVDAYQFVFAGNGKEALELVQANQDIEILVLDINMPKMDGLSLLKTLTEKKRNIVSVILSAYGDMSNIRTAMNLGAFDFITKPVNFKDLESTLIKTIAHAEQIKLNARTVHENLILKQKASDLEMQALRSQMNPHFIFNSLSSINNFILRHESTQASAYLIKFSSLIRRILENSTETMIPMAEELESTKLYIEIESLRFNHVLSYSIDVSSDIDLSSILVPPLILQPFIENAIHHGLMPKNAPGNIQIKISEKENLLWIIIEDDGIGRPQENTESSKATFKNKSLGIKTTKSRIDLFSQNLQSAGDIQIQDLKDDNQEAAGTKITIQLPIHYAIHTPIVSASKIDAA